METFAQDNTEAGFDQRRELVKGMNLRLSTSFKYNQKEVLAENILRYIRNNTIKSLLDIGAGDGAVSVHLAKEVSRYLALEENRESVEKLTVLGLDVVNTSFPDAVLPECFDMVLSSHSIPEGDIFLYESFLTKAWHLVCVKGTLLIITFKGSDDDPVIRLAESITGKKGSADLRYMEMMRILGTFGQIRVEKVNSYVTTQEVDDLKELFGHRFWQNDAEKKERDLLFRQVMDQHFNENGLYSVPTQHLFISVKK